MRAFFLALPAIAFLPLKGPTVVVDGLNHWPGIPHATAANRRAAPRRGVKGSPVRDQ